MFLRNIRLSPNHTALEPRTFFTVPTGTTSDSIFSFKLNIKIPRAYKPTRKILSLFYIPGQENTKKKHSELRGKKRSSHLVCSKSFLECNVDFLL
jgi:hypothetical protein